MTYVTSDWHGYPFEKIQNTLTAIGFNESDRLYVLGDCVDRGQDGIRLLLYCMKHANITLLLGNHEAMMLKNRFLFDGDTVPTAMDLVGERRHTYYHWISNGGDVTLEALEGCRSEVIQRVFDYLEELPLYKEIEVNGKRYILTHSGLGDFHEDKPLSRYTPTDLLWTRPSLGTTYYRDGRIVIFGHTPTFLYGSSFEGKPLITDTWINIDVGAARGLPPLLLRLEDGKQIRVRL